MCYLLVVLLGHRRLKTLQLSELLHTIDEKDHNAEDREESHFQKLLDRRTNVKPTRNPKGEQSPLSSNRTRNPNEP